LSIERGGVVMNIIDIRQSPDGRYDLWSYKKLAVGREWTLVSWGHDSYNCALNAVDKLKGGKV
jgi:hypothetical protein